MSPDLDDRLHQAGAHYRSRVSRPPSVLAGDLPRAAPAKNRFRYVAAVAAATALVAVCSVSVALWRGHHQESSGPPASARGLSDTTWYQRTDQPSDGGILQFEHHRFSLHWGCNTRTGTLKVTGTLLVFSSPTNPGVNDCGVGRTDQQVDEVTSNGSTRWSLTDSTLTLRRGGTLVTLRNDTVVLGRLLVSGGPAGTPSRGVAGRIEIRAGTDATRPPLQTVDTGPSGGFVVHLRAGTYLFAGKWNDNDCSSDGPVQVRGASLTVAVVCSIK